MHMEARKSVAARIKRLVKFGGSSLISTAVDQVVAGILFVVLDAPLAGYDLTRIFISTAVARVLSVIVNFSINSKKVFAGTDWHRSLPRFLLLACVVLGLSSLGVYLLHTLLGVNESVAKICVDLALFFLNYNVQRRWVFKV